MRKRVTVSIAEREWRISRRSAHKTRRPKKTGESAFDGVNWKWLLPLLLFPPASTPPRREISVTANVNGKSVVITYDPHDPEAAKAADVWRKALFAEPSKDAPAPAFERIRREGYCLRQPAAETVKNGKPATPEIIADPGNYGVIGFWWEDWADGSFFLRWRTEPGADAMKVVRLTGNPDCGFRIEIPSDGAEDVATPENGIPWEPRFFEAHSKADAMRKIETEIRGHIKADDVRRLTWIRVKEPPRADLRHFVDAVKKIARALGELIGETIAKLTKTKNAHRVWRSRKRPVNQYAKPLLIDKRRRVYRCRNAC